VALTTLACVLLIVAAARFDQAPAATQQPPVSTWSYSELLSHAQVGAVTSVSLGGGSALAVDTGGGLHRIAMPARTTDLAATLAADGVQVTYQGPGLSGVLKALAPYFLPFLIVAALGWLAVSRTRRAGAAAMAQTASPARVVAADGPAVTFAEVAGAEEAKQELAEVVELLTTPERFSAVGARVPRGVLLSGPPGTGKTLLARAVAGQAGVPFLTVSASQFVELFAGRGAARVRALFAHARSLAPCVVFVDEIDAVGRHRHALGGAGGGEREQTLNQILVEMDGFTTGTSEAGVMVLAATNRPDVLDPALVRPGRFDRHVRVDLPDLAGREEILAVHTRDKPLDAGVNLSAVAQQTAGFSGADLANLANESAILAVRAGHATIASADLDEALARVVAGPRRPSRHAPEPELAVLAYHQAGHALVMSELTGCDEVRRVSIGARGGRLGWIMSVRREDGLAAGRAALRDRLAALLGGRVAEELVFEDVSSEAEDDIAAATRLARQMVGRWGMGEAIASTSAGRRTTAGFDAEVAGLLRTTAERARTVLTARRDHLDQLAKRLLAEETVTF
jgi:cell division protease FtsH